MFAVYLLKVDMVSGVIQILTCKTNKYRENHPQQQRRLCRQILLPTSTKVKAAWPLGNAAETAADGRGCRGKSSALKLDQCS